MGQVENELLTSLAYNLPAIIVRKLQQKGSKVKRVIKAREGFIILHDDSVVNIKYFTNNNGHYIVDISLGNARIQLDIYDSEFETKLVRFIEHNYSFLLME